MLEFWRVLEVYEYMQAFRASRVLPTEMTIIVLEVKISCSFQTAFERLVDLRHQPAPSTDGKEAGQPRGCAFPSSSTRAFVATNSFR